MTNRPGFPRIFRRSGSRGQTRIFGQVFRLSGLPLLFHTRAHMRSRIFRRNTLLARVADRPGFRLLSFRPKVLILSHRAAYGLPASGMWSNIVRRIGQAFGPVKWIMKGSGSFPAVLSIFRVALIDSSSRISGPVICPAVRSVPAPAVMAICPACFGISGDPALGPGRSPGRSIRSQKSSSGPVLEIFKLIPVWFLFL